MNTLVADGTKQTPLQVCLGLQPKPPWRFEAQLPEDTELWFPSSVAAGQLPAGKTAGLDAKIGQALVDVQCPELQRVGAAGWKQTCALAAFLEAANPVIELKDLDKPTVFRKIKAGSQQHAVTFYRCDISNQISVGVLRAVNAGTLDVNAVSAALQEDKPVSTDMLAIVAYVAKFNVFLVDGTESDDKVTCLGKFVPANPAVALYVAHTAIEDDSSGDEEDSKAGSPAVQSLEVLRRKSDKTTVFGPSDSVTVVSPRPMLACNVLGDAQALASLAGVADKKLGSFDHAAYEPRVEAKANIKKQADLIARKHGKNKRIKEFAVWDLVAVFVPQLDRGRHSTTNIKGIIVERKEAGYRVR
jgi:hypothetical protein